MILKMTYCVNVLLNHSNELRFLNFCYCAGARDHRKQKAKQYQMKINWHQLMSKRFIIMVND